MEENKKKIPNRKYRLTVYDDESLDEITTFRLTKYNIFSYAGIVIIIISIIVAVLFIFTPLNLLIPSRAGVEVQKDIIANSLLIDTIENEIQSGKKYINQIKNILQGKAPQDTFTENREIVEKIGNGEELNFQTSELDSILKAQIEKTENEALPNIENVNTSANLANLHFVVPLKGMISREFDLKSGHLGIDIVPGTDETILATLPGTVVIAAWSIETGYVVELQHDNNLISFYKHNSVLLKKVGDRVVAGESIATVGNSGEETTGPHLHFELWYNGSPVNPRDYITF